MSDKITWKLENHTKAKHEILQNYLAAWFPILSSVSRRIVYIDGFAGPGIYNGGEEGSPLIAIRTAFEHILKHRFKEIFFLFIEKNEERSEKLKVVLKSKFPNLPNENFKYEVVSGEFEDTVYNILSGLEEKESNLAPTFAFIDPFGFTGFPMELLEKIMSYPRCEIFITFMSGFIKRFLDDEKTLALNKLFKTDEWKKIREREDPRDQQVLDLYLDQLKSCCDIEHLLSFKMINKFNQELYHLVFGTNHKRGLERMKEAIWRVDRTGNFTFSDLIPENQSSITSFVSRDWDHWVPKAAFRVFSKFKGQKVPIEVIKDYILVSTVYLFRKSIFQYLEKSDPPKIESVYVPERKRRKGSFPDDCIIHFSG